MRLSAHDLGGRGLKATSFRLPLQCLHAIKTQPPIQNPDTQNHKSPYTVVFTRTLISPLEWLGRGRASGYEGLR